MDAASVPARSSGLPEESAEELYDEAPCGYVSFSWTDGTITRVNKTFLHWTDRRREELVGATRFQDLLSKAGRIIYETRCVPMLRLGRAANAVMLEVACGTDRRLSILANIVVQLDASGTPLLVRLTAFDATERRRYERELVDARNKAQAAEAEARWALGAAQAADLAKARFLSAMNHEFRTPISIVLGFSELLLETAQTGRSHPRQAEYLADVRAAARHLLGLVEDSTRYAELARMEGRLPKDQTKVGALASAAVQLARAELMEAGIVVELPQTACALCLWVDAASMAEAIACILREFARRVPRNTSIELGYWSDPVGVMIAVRCAAFNLPEATLLALPDTRELHSRGLEGAGLGFAIAAHIIGLHGGCFGALTSSGGGTNIQITMPYQIP